MLIGEYNKLDSYGKIFKQLKARLKNTKPIKIKQGPCLNKKKKQNIVETEFDTADTDVNNADVESCGEDSDDIEEKNR